MIMTLLGSLVDKYDEGEEDALPEVKRYLDLHSNAAEHRLLLIDLEEELIGEHLKDHKWVGQYREMQGGEGASIEYSSAPIPDEDFKEGITKVDVMEILTASPRWERMRDGHKHLVERRNDAKTQFEETCGSSGTKKELIQVLIRECGAGVISGGFRPEEVAELVGCSEGYAKKFVYRDPSEEVRGDKREAVLKNEEGLRKKDQCAACGGESPLQVHHIIPMRDSGTKNMENLATLCRSCHREAHSGTWGPIIYDTVDEFWDWVENHSLKAE